MNPSSRSRLASPLVAAVLASAAVGGQHIASKAARDAIFLANFETASLPAMVMTSAIFSIALVAASTRLLRRIPPASWVPTVFGAMAVLLLADWALAMFAPGPAARMLFLIVSGVGPLLGSGFWLIVTERFDPHTAKKVFGQVAGAATLGGLLGGLSSAWLPAVADVGAMLPWVAGLSLAGAWLIRRFAALPGPASEHGAISSASASSGLRVLAGAAYLRSLAALEHTDAQALRGTALEYLESVLPGEIRDQLWPFLESDRLPSEIRKPHEDTLAALLRSDESIRARLEELKIRAATARRNT